MRTIKLEKATLTVYRENGSTEEIVLSNIIKIEREKEPDNWHRGIYTKPNSLIFHPIDIMLFTFNISQCFPSSSVLICQIFIFSFL